MSEKVKEEGTFKVKPKKPKNLNKPNAVTKVEIPKVDAGSQGEVIPEVTKVDLTEKVVDVTESKTEEVTNETIEEKVEDTDSESILQEITDEEEVIEVTKELEKAVQENKETGKPLPENVEKLVAFMEDTGGNLEDYVRLSSDYSTVDSTTLLKEYYKTTKPYLEGDDIDLILEDFEFDEDIDEDRDIRKKKLAFKEEVAKARNFLEETKSKYYDEIKLRPGVTQEQQKATDFFNRHNDNQEAAKAKHNDFLQKTKSYLNQDFKGFDFNVGEKKFRYGVKNVNDVAEKQSDISNFIGTFLDKEGNISDHKSYHKALYAAQNADTIAQHFYEQGKADAVKDVVAKSKNISTEPRQQSSGNVFVNGYKVKAISGNDSSKLKIKTKKFN
tara:strand:- start:11 stop:1168 length:1158 start_codon:yes stop_codon:yes gene_type:complete